MEFRSHMRITPFSFSIGELEEGWMKQGRQNVEHSWEES
jgi:hypothetical protein